MVAQGKTVELGLLARRIGDLFLLDDIQRITDRINFRQLVIIQADLGARLCIIIGHIMNQ